MSGASSSIFPEGFNTQVGDGGEALSGGQRHVLARASLVWQAGLVVLDEPNANLDAAGEDALLKAVQTLKSLQTTL